MSPTFPDDDFSSSVVLDAPGRVVVVVVVVSGAAPLPSLDPPELGSVVQGCCGIVSTRRCNLRYLHHGAIGISPLLQ